MTRTDYLMIALAALLFFGVIWGVISNHATKMREASAKVGDLVTILPPKVISVAASRAKPVDIGDVKYQISNVRWAINR